MPRYPLQGISALSQLTIDADKDWATKGISNLKELALGMALGDIAVKGPGGVLVKITPGIANTVLTSAGPGALPTWAPGGTYLNRYLPAPIYLSKAAAVRNPDRSDAEPAHLSTQHVETYGDLPASMVKQLTPAPTLTDAEDVMAAADQVDAETAAIHTHYGLQKVVDGAGIHDEGVGDTDETAAAQNTTANDMTLMLAGPAVDDAYYFGWNYKWDKLWLNIGTAGNGNWAITEEYWDNVAGSWQTCVGMTSDMNQFMVSGLRYFQHTPQANWTASLWNGMTWYWVRFRVSAFVNIVTQPLGTQAWCERFI